MCVLATLGLFFRGDFAPAMGWFARGRRILEDGRYDCVEQAWLLMLTALPLMFEGHTEAAYPSFVEAEEIAERFGDSDATMFARLGRGELLVQQGRITEGIALLDEVMVAVTTDEVSPMIAGIAYCQVMPCARRSSTYVGRGSGPRRSPAGAIRSPTSCRTEATVSFIAARSSN